MVPKPGARHPGCIWLGLVVLAILGGIAALGSLGALAEEASCEGSDCQPLGMVVVVPYLAAYVMLILIPLIFVSLWTAARAYGGEKALCELVAGLAALGVISLVAFVVMLPL